MEIVLLFLGAAGGYALCWFTKDTVITLISSFKRTPP
jgi:hypothetical protein